MSERQESTEGVNSFSEEERRIERLLASLKPRENHIDRDRLMFLAGQASTTAGKNGRKGSINRWTWPAGMILATCAGLLIGLFISTDRRPDPRNTLTTAEPARSDQLKSALPLRTAAASLATRNEQEPSDVDERAQRSETLLVGQFDNERIIESDRASTQLELRDRLLAGQSDEMALAEIDGWAANRTKTVATEPPASERNLLQRWFRDQGHNQL